MILLIYGGKSCGKKTIVNYLTKEKGFIYVDYDPNLYSLIVKGKQWRSNYVAILPSIEDWENFKKRPCSRLMVIYSPSASNWRNQNDDFFYSQIDLHGEAFKVLNYGKVSDLMCKVEKSLVKIRPSWNSYFMEIAFKVAQRSNCMKGRVGCVIVRDNRIVSTGYNGTPTKFINCYENGCERCNEGNGCNKGLDYCFCIHAEESALLFIGKQGCENGELYVTRFPCTLCCRKILQMGIKKVYYLMEYGQSDENIRKIFEESGIGTEKIEI